MHATVLRTEDCILPFTLFAESCRARFDPQEANFPSFGQENRRIPPRALGEACYGRNSGIE